MSTVEELRVRLLYFIKLNGVSIQLGKLNSDYIAGWREPFNVSYHKIANLQKMLNLKKCVKKILRGEVEIHKGIVYLKGFSPKQSVKTLKSNNSDFQVITDKDYVSLESLVNPQDSHMHNSSELFLKTMKNTSSKCAEKSLKKSLGNIMGKSKNTAIPIEEDDHEDTNEKIKESEYLNNQINVVDSFEQYRSFQLVHVAYCKLRIVAMMYSLKKDVLYVYQLKLWFKEMYRENFFTKNVLQYFISETESHFKHPELFLQRFCSDFILLSEDNITSNVLMTLTSDIKPLYLKLLDELIQLLEKLELPNSFLSENLIPSEITLIQNSEDQPIDVLRIPDRFGNCHKMFFFPNLISSNHIKERPTLNEINEKVTQIQNKISRRGDAVRVIDIVKELCLFYNVSCVKDLHTLDSRPFRQDSDIPAIFNIMKLQGKINAFIQSFINFRNICTLYELNQEICKLDSKTSFVDYKLGPLQKQILIYDYFQFPPNKQDIPQITTCDIFNLIWKLENERYQNEKRGVKGLLESNNSNSRFSLTEFMDYFIKQHGFTEPYESGVRIASISLAVFVVKKAKLGDFHHEKEMVKKFNSQLREDLNIFLSKMLKEIVGTQNPGQNLIEKMRGMKLPDAFNQLYLMLQHLKQEAFKKLYFGTSTANLINFSDTAMNALLIIQKDPLMSSIFHIILSTAPLKVLGMDDVAILNYLGFEDTIKQMADNQKEIANNYSNIVPVPKELVMQTANKWFSQNNELTLDSLSRIERQIISAINEQLHSFDDLGHGSFLKFLIENENLKELVEYGLKTVSQNKSECVSKDDIGIFIYQCGDQGCKDDINIAAKIQFNLKDLLIKTNFALPTNTLFQYQHAVLCGTEYQKQLISSTDSVEILTKLAISKINVLPYLEDILKLLNWDEIFQRKLGDFKEFVESKFNLKDVCYFFLELKFGKFVKVLKDCSIDLFTEAFIARDAKLVSLSLTSIICSNGRLEHAPLALLSNVVQKNMFVNSLEFSDNNFLIFILECFQLIPFDLLCCIIHKMFLSPLSTLYGNLNVPSLLLEACNNYTSCKSRLHALGFQLSIVEWIENYKDEIFLVKDLKTTEENEKQDVRKLQVPKRNENMEAKHDETSISITETEEFIMESSPSLEQVSGEFKELFDSSFVQNNECQEIINSIRREQFGVGVEFGEQEMKLIEVHREREGRSLQHLSNELYSKDSHFVLELIQNADDNNYPETFFQSNSIEKPAVAFIVEHDKITILNNEKGFSEKDIKALCDIGKSTKGVHCKGYIGQKGIGFKSVFRVTDSPEIHSNGYHIKFDASCGSNGYILPYWIDSWELQSKLLYQPSKKQNYTWITQIVLPLKKEMQHTKLTSRFYDIHPSLLLFLNRLHTIIIDDKVSNVIKVIERESLDENLVRLSNNNDSALWFVVGNELNIDIRQDVKSTNLAVAFPLNNLKDELLPNQPVYAYLPLRSYGFKFIIQADFEVPSSREDINKDSAWNQCILQHIPKLIVKAFHCFKNHRHFNGLEGVITYLKFMDLEDHVLGVFKQVSHQIIKSLQREACLPAMSIDSNPNAPISWVIPSCIIHPRENVLRVISQEMLQEKLGLYYLNKDIYAVISKKVLFSLGVSEMTLDSLLEICRLIVHQFGSSTQTEEDRAIFHKWIGKWLQTVYLRLQDQCDCSEKTLNILRSLYIYPMSDRSMKSLNNHVVFFPVSGNNKIFNKKGDQPIHLIEQDLSILSHDFMSCLSGVEQQQLNNFLHDLGVKEITPLDIIQNCIIPAFKSGKWKEKSENLVVAYVVYFHEQYMLNSKNFDIFEIRQWIMLLTNKGFRSPFDSSNPIYFGREYNNDIDLQNHFPSADWTFVSNSYLSSSTDIEKVSLKRFLTSLSVQTFMVVRKTTKTLHVSDMITSCWDKFFETWPQTIDDTYIIDDLECPEFNQIVDGKDYGEINKMLEELDKRWSEFSKFNFIRPGCVVKNTSGEIISSTYCSFLLKMRSSSWLANNEDESSLHFPRDLFLRNDPLFSLLCNKVNYLTNRVKSKDFILTLGVQTEVEFKRFAKEFKKWREEAVFITNYAHTQTIYQYFEKQNAVYNKKINELKNGLFIFLPVNHCNHLLAESSVVEGKFYSINKLCWEDPSEIIQTKDEADHRRILKGYYHDDIRNYFIYTLGVSRYPSICEYVKLASSIASQTNLPDRDGCEKLYTIFSVLGHLMIADNKLEEIKDLNFPESMEERRQQYEELSSFIDPMLSKYMQKTDLLGEKIFPTSKNNFSCLSDLPLLVDNKDCARIFQECEKVPLIYIDFILNMIKPSYSSRSKRAFEAFDLKMIHILVFFKACDVQLLSKVYIEPEVITENMKRGCVTWEKIIHEISPIVQRFLSVKFPVFYNDLTAKFYHEYIKSSTVFSVDTLETVYRLFDRSDVVVSQKKVACVSDAGGKRALIYITSQYASEKTMFEQILSEVLNLYVSQNEEVKEDLFDFIQIYLAVSNKEDYLKRKNITELPYSDIRWTYPLSIICSESVIVSKPTQNVTPTQVSAAENRGLKCWPPRNPAGPGSVFNSETSKHAENEVNEKWKPPESPVELPVVNENLSTRDTNISINDTEDLKRKRKHSCSSSELVEINGDPVLSKKICAGLSQQVLPHDLYVPIIEDGIINDFESPCTRWKLTKKIGCVSSAVCQNVKFTNQIDFTLFEKQILEEQYEDLPIILSDSYKKDILDLSFDQKETESKQMIGKLGENLVYQHLCEIYKDEILSGKAKITWLNEVEENGQPYDLKIDFNELEQKCIYIEVKTSYLDGKKEFEISANQLRFAFEKQSTFHLYRVTGINANLRIKRLVNLSMYMDCKSVRLFMLI